MSHRHPVLIAMGVRARDLRHAAGLIQREVAAAAGLSQRAVSRVEGGDAGRTVGAVTAIVAGIEAVAGVDPLRGLAWVIGDAVPLLVAGPPPADELRDPQPLEPLRCERDRRK